MATSWANIGIYSLPLPVMLGLVQISGEEKWKNASLFLNSFNLICFHQRTICKITRNLVHTGTSWPEIFLSLCLKLRCDSALAGWLFIPTRWKMSTPNLQYFIVYVPAFQPTLPSQTLVVALQALFGSWRKILSNWDTKGVTRYKTVRNSACAAVNFWSLRFIRRDR